SYRPPVRAMREAFRNLTGARGLSLCIHVANKDEVAAGSSGNTLGVEGSADNNAIDKFVPPPRGRARAAFGQFVEEGVRDIVRGLHMGTVDERHDDVVNAGLRLNRNFRKTLHDLNASLGPLGVESPILRTTNGLAEHRLAIEHDDERALIL